MFIEEQLQHLRRDRFSLPALVRYVRAVAGQVRAGWDANPSAVRSVWSVALMFFAADFVAAASLAVRFGARFGVDFFLATALIILLAFAMVSFSVALLRDHQGFRLSALNLPTMITLLRVALLPGLVLFLLDRHFALALATFAIAALSDVADGWLARRWDQCTPLGRVLDPIVDIGFTLGVFAALFAAELVPAWVFAMVMLRYGILIMGGTSLYLFVGPVKIQPTTFGRMTGVVMSFLIGLLALLHIVHRPLAEKLLPLTETALGVLMAATVVHVLVLGWYNLRLMTGRAEAQGRVVGDVRWGGS
ncbi:MAG: CDP-alcohol phosphatidyltransferase family protein [Candidatus Eisenbacteria bacterium]